MKKLPISVTIFRDFTEENFCYVDKTKYIKLLYEEKRKYYFLSRPRRFGKSLLLDTIKEAYSGEKELFKGLYLENNWDWNVKYPVIKLSFGGGSVFDSKGFEETAKLSLKIAAYDYKCSIDEKNYAATIFKSLIFDLFHKFNTKVVILIDEYDKPLLDNITKPEAKLLREELASFYSVLKDSENFIKLVFITGVSKFSKTSIFSKLNNILDISLTEKYADICGYTQKDLETVFADYLHDVDLQKVKNWYDGYNFLGENLYNPFNILLFLNEKKYKPYWFETGTPTFLMELIKERKFFVPKLEDTKVSGSQMSEFDIDNIEFVVLLYQAGYLTIKREELIFDDYFYTLKFPNKEVRKGLSEYLSRMLYTQGSNASSRTQLAISIHYALAENEPEKLETAFYTFFAGIPHDWYRKNNISDFEGFYASMFYALFAGLAVDMVAEDTTNKGKIDLMVEHQKGIFIFEFKMKSNPQNALQQIKEKKYHEKYTQRGKEIFLIGIEFDEEAKNISAFECEHFLKK